MTNRREITNQTANSRGKTDIKANQQNGLDTAG